jgi:putative protease
MKFLCTIPNVDAFNQVKHLCDGVVMTNKKYSSRYETSFSFDEILQIVKKCNTARMESYLIVDNILTDSDIPAIYELINTFKDTNLFYIFGDLAVYQILKEFNITKKGVYNPNTLISNYVDFIFWKDYKVKGLFPTLEIPLTDIEIIGKNKKVKLFYKGFGMNVMFHSKRKLLSSYKEHKNVLFDFVGSNDLHLVEETRKESYKIIENEHGTHIYQPGIHNILPAFDIAANELDYLFLDGTFLDWDKYIKAVEIYKDALLDMDRLNYYNTKLEELFDNLTYNFLLEDSIFRKSDF